MDLIECATSNRKRGVGRLRLPEEKTGKGVVGIVVVVGKILAWTAAAFAALTALGVGARWLISTSFVARDAAAAELATRSEMRTLERLEAEHYQLMQEAVRELSRVNDEGHREIKADTNRILNLLLQDRRRP